MEASLVEQLRAATETTPQSSRGGNKRKRNVAEQASAPRGAPANRRNQQYEVQVTDIKDMMATAPADDNADAFLQSSAAQFSYPNMSSNTQQEEDTSNVDTAAAALNYSMQVPQYPDDVSGPANVTQAGDQEQYNGEAAAEGTEDVDGQVRGPTGGHAQDTTASEEKPAIGSEEWTRQRKDNHKEVERRRRETINEGINELAKIVPTDEKSKSANNKGSILVSAVQYINKLRDECSQNIDKWAWEKLVTEQAIADLSTKLHRAWAEKEAWKKLAKDAGVDVENVDLQLDEEEIEKAADEAEEEMVSHDEGTEREAVAQQDGDGPE